LIIPLHKRGSLSDPCNYRGLNIVPVVSKVAEKCILEPLVTHLERVEGFGKRQFAFRRKIGCRDYLTVLLTRWIQALNNRQKVARFGSDIQGAFDHVSTVLLLDKLQKKGVRGDLLKFFSDYLCDRSYNVVVGGAKSIKKPLTDSVYQGVPGGPLLWNVFLDIESYEITSAIASSCGVNGQVSCRLR
jgi:hypothetical protein